jgi:CRP/FNR family transcriptional regulator, cyclic AMP receptor protein
MKTVRFSEDGRVMILDLIDTGDVFGEMSLVDEGESEPTFAEALEPVEIESISRFAFERALTGRPALAIAVARLMGARRNRIERRLGTHVFLRAPTRLAILLLELTERFGKATASPPSSTGDKGPRFVIDIPLSQREIGNLIGVSREIVNLTLSDLRRRGAVSMLRRRIVIAPDELRRVAVDVEGRVDEGQAPSSTSRSRVPAGGGSGARSSELAALDSRESRRNLGGHASSNGTGSALARKTER